MEHLLALLADRFGWWTVLIGGFWLCWGIVIIGRQPILRQAAKTARQSPQVIFAVRFWAIRLNGSVPPAQLERFSEVLARRLVASYMKHTSYPDIGIGDMVRRTPSVGSEDILFEAAAEAGIVASTPAGRQQFAAMVPHGRMQIAHSHVTFIGDDAKVVHLWSDMTPLPI